MAKRSIKCSCWTRRKPGVLWQEGSIVGWRIPAEDLAPGPGPDFAPELAEDIGQIDMKDEAVAKNFFDRMAENQEALYGHKED